MDKIDLPTEGRTPTFGKVNTALQGNAKWLRLEEKLAAKPTDEVSRWVQLYFMLKETAAQNASFKDTSTLFMSFSVKILKYSIDFYMNICYTIHNISGRINHV